MVAPLALQVPREVVSPLCRAQVRVDSRGRDPGVAQRLLNHLEVRAVLAQPQREGLPEHGQHDIAVVGFLTVTVKARQTDAAGSSPRSFGAPWSSAKNSRRTTSGPVNLYCPGTPAA